MTKLLMLVNRRSRGGAADLSAFVRRLQEGGHGVRLETPDSPDAMAQAILGHCGEVDGVVIAGGDGTLSRAAPALCGCGRPLGILPLGTANDLAHTLGLPAEPLAVADIIAGGHRRPLDLGEVNGVLFFNAAQLGLGTQVTHELSTSQKRRWGVLSYLRAFYRTWRRTRPFTATIVCDGERVRLQAIQVTVGNGRRHGGGITIDEAASPYDGVFHLYVLQPQPLWRVALSVLLLRRSTGNAKTVKMSGGSVEIRTEPPIQLVTDGEPAGQTPARFRLIPGAIQVFVPPSAEGEGHGAA